MGAVILPAVDPIVYDERPPLTEPPVVCAFQGWNDGGEAASMAARYLADRWEAKPFAHLDPEEYYDFQVTRPSVRLEGGVSRVIEWPRGEFATASVGGRDVVVFTAAEPSMRWRSFTTVLVQTARSLGSNLLVTLGAFLTDVPHTRPVPVVGSAADEGAALRLGLPRSKYEGPTGIVGVLHDASNRAGLPSVSLWAAVPHYLPSGPNPEAALALVRRTSAVLGIPVDTDPLVEAAAEWEQETGRLVADSDELSEYVRRLELAADDEEPGDDTASAGGQIADEPVPSADAIGAEVERFLREQGGGEQRR
jgi:predicted ATP-grasp superfamily ATP-dependent carboligase